MTETLSYVDDDVRLPDKQMRPVYGEQWYFVRRLETYQVEYIQWYVLLRAIQSSVQSALFIVE